MPLDWTSRSTSASDIASASGSGGQSSSRTLPLSARSGRDCCAADVSAGDAPALARSVSAGDAPALANSSSQAILSLRPGLLDGGDELVDIRVKHTFLDIPDFKFLELDGVLQHRQVVSAPATAVHSRESTPRPQRAWSSSAAAAEAEDERPKGTPPLPATRRVIRSSALALEPGLISNPEMISCGSAGHAYGKCKPCAFIHKQGCESGVSCKFCHLCPSGEKKRRKQVKKTKGAFKKEGRANTLQPLRSRDA